MSLYTATIIRASHFFVMMHTKTISDFITYCITT